MKKILLLGGTGLIGQHFMRAYHKAFSFTLITRNPKKAQKRFAKLDVFNWDKLSETGFIDKFEVVINLAGSSIAAKRWSTRYQKKLLSSRLETTAKIIDALLNAKNPPRLLNASAIGIYGYHPIIKQQMASPVSEYHQPDFGVPSFAKSLVEQWENKLSHLADKNLPYVCLRFGVVLAPWGGALPKMARPFLWGVGGSIGSGKQPFSWCHINDCVRAIYFIIMHPDISGPVNIVSPEVVSNKTFAKQLALTLNTHANIPVPYIVVWLLFGQMGKELMLNGQYVKPEVLSEKGFRFAYPLLSQALNHLYKT